LASTRLVFCDVTLPNLTKGKNTHPEGEREEQKERTNVPLIDSTHQHKSTKGINPKENLCLKPLNGKI
jgi:hypothetical protein